MCILIYCKKIWGIDIKAYFLSKCKNQIYRSMYSRHNPTLLTYGYKFALSFYFASLSILRSYNRYKVPAAPPTLLCHRHIHTRTHVRYEYLCEKNVASTLRRPDARMCRTHARPFGYISQAALIPAHIQSHPLILARSRRKKGREDVARGPTGLPLILVSCTCTPFRLIRFLSPSLFYSASKSENSLPRSLFFSFTHTQVTDPRAIEEMQRWSAASPPRHPRQNSRPVFLNRSLTHAFTHGASMKITYAVMSTGDPVRSIDSGGASAARRAVKITLKNLKRWCARLRHGTTRDFKDNWQNLPEEIKIVYDGNITTTMIVDQEESRNRANENLENELRENLAINLRHIMRTSTTVNSDQWLGRGWTTCWRSARSGDRRRSSSRRNENLKVVLVAFKIA